MTHTLAICYATWLLAAGLTALLTAGVAWRRRAAPGAVPLVLLMLAITEWAVAYALHWVAPSPEARRGWLDATFLGAGLCAALVWLLTRELTGPRRRLTPLTALALFGVPAVTVGLLLLGDPRGLLFGADRRPDAHTLLQGGPWFRVMVVHGYALLLASALRLARLAWRASALQRSQAGLLLAGLCLPWAVNLGGLLGARPLPDLDLTPVLFMVTGLVFLWGIVGFRLFDVVPVARHLLVEQMGEGVVVLDTEHRVIDLNPAARRLANRALGSPIGQPVEVVFSPWPRALEPYLGVEEARGELVLELPEVRYLDLRISPLYDRRRRLRGRLVIWRDVTARREAEARLRQAHTQLEARVVEIEELQRRLQDQSVRDPLTGLHNRRFLEKALAGALERAAQTGRPFSLVMLDIDHFKAINDSAGHAAGDAVLQGVARLLEEARQPGETLCRYGGEEFVAVLPDTGAAAAAERAEAWRAAVERLPVVDSEVDGERPLHCTVSLGVASFPDHGADADVVLAAADRALYRAKHLGRNGVQVAGPSPAPDLEERPLESVR